MAAQQEIVRLENITKRFGGVTALDDVSFSIAKGEVHAVVGENGAGKSTLMKMLAGVHSQDSGQIVLHGTPVAILDPLDARSRGISIVFQELNLFPDLSASGNIFINRELSARWGRLDQRAMDAAAQQVFAMMEMHIDPRVKVKKLSVGEKQLVEIARTLQQQSEIIIMDEANSALTQHETDRLFEIIRRLRDQGFTIIYVSHRLEEVFAIADRITVLRDGHYQGTWRTSETTIPKVVEAMIGRRLEEAFPARPPVPANSPMLLEVRDLTKGKVGPVSFQVRAGEILGFAGLEGSGVEDVFRVLFGLEPLTSGEVIYGGQSQRLRSPVEAIKLGWGLIPANRREQGLMINWSVRRNTTLVVLNKLLNRLGLIDATADRRTADDYVRHLNIATDSIDKKVINLSGGNQQKVVVAKWLASGPKILILHDPTRGVDVGAKSEIYRLCDQLAQQGLALLFTSSEVDEILGLCDRVLAFYKGRALREFKRGEATKSDVMHVIASGANGNAGRAN
jgi:ABC-type sugar transport system ATPase subunit